MAIDKRRYVRVTITEEHAAWIEARFKLDSDANKADAVKALIDEAMNGQKNAAQPVAPIAVANAPAVPPVAPCALSAEKETLRIISATLDMLIQKYMADHPEKELSGDQLATLGARWRIFTEQKRPAYIANGGYLAT